MNQESELYAKRPMVFGGLDRVRRLGLKRRQS